MPKIHLALCFDLSRQTVRDEKVWLPLVPPGVFSGNDGRTWNNSNPDAVVASFTKKRPFDIESGKTLRNEDVRLDDPQPRPFSLRIFRRVAP